MDLTAFLDNPYEAEVSQLEIPSPIAPARPVQATVGTITPTTGMWNGQSVTGVDSVGHVIGPNGTVIGTMPGTAGATVGSNPVVTDTGSGRAASLGVTPQGEAQVATSPGGYANSFTMWIQNHMEDLVFIVIGIVFIIAGLATLGFQGAEKVVDTASGGVSRISKAAGKAAKLAELAP